ncbi:hypothetical protein CSB09_01270 [Candidatus Gracilibacteria bacterium]|nr:MAG: hypothetical protein CSB09_01270 [Candidatus Gracilibacteria bacterium]
MANSTAKITSLSLHNFYGVDDWSADISENTHCIGSNGSGKTHILNALHLALGGKVLYGKNKLLPGTKITFTVQDANGMEMVYLFGNDGKKEYTMRGETIYTKPKYLQNLPIRSVFISPFDMNMLYFAPQIRRDYLDNVCARAYPNFIKVQRDFERTMRQRNALLKNIREGQSAFNDLDFWDSKFAEIAYLYGQYRIKFIDFITSIMPEFPQFFGKYVIQINYAGDWIYQEDPVGYIKTYLKNKRQRDILSGHTHIGPHRDDFGFYIKDNDDEITENVQSFLSRGEMKMLLIGLKIGEAKWIQEKQDVSVIILLDDLFSELDPHNSDIFLDSIIQHQIFLTSQTPHKKTLKNKQFTCINL